MLPEVIITDSVQEMARLGADLFYQRAVDSVEKAGLFAAAVSGGSTPRPVHRRIAASAMADRIPWQSVRLFWVDERMVGARHSDSNFGNAKSDLLDRVPLPEEHVFPMPFWMTPRLGAETYAKVMRLFFQRCKNGAPVFDLIFLGLGEDGHTASLFPQTDVSESSRKWVLAVKGGRPEVHRLTLNYCVLNQARQVCFLVAGANKAKMVKRILEGGGNSLPAQRIKPFEGKVTWICDRSAAGLLDRCD